MRVTDVMTRGVISIAADASMRDAAQRMLQYELSGLPVLDHDGRLVGILSEGDFLRRPEIDTAPPRPRWLNGFVDPGRLAADYVHMHGRRVEQVMTREVVAIPAEATLEEAVTLMERHRIKRLPVVDGDRMVGIVTRTDLLHAFVVGSRPKPAGSADDAALRARLRGELDAQPWAPRESLDIVVVNGTVDLYGTVADERQRAALGVAAENVPGVRAVRDHLRVAAANDAAAQ